MHNDYWSLKFSIEDLENDYLSIGMYFSQLNMIRVNFVLNGLMIWSPIFWS